MSDVTADVTVVTRLCNNFISDENSSKEWERYSDLRQICEAFFFIYLKLIKGWKEFPYVCCVINLIVTK